MRQGRANKECDNTRITVTGPWDSILLGTLWEIVWNWKLPNSELSPRDEKAEGFIHNPLIGWGFSRWTPVGRVCWWPPRGERETDRERGDWESVNVRDSEGISFSPKKWDTVVGIVSYPQETFFRLAPGLHSQPSPPQPHTNFFPDYQPPVSVPELQVSWLS